MLTCFMDLPMSTDQFAVKVFLNLTGHVLLFFHLSILATAFQQSQLSSDFFTFFSYLPTILVTLIVGTFLIMLFPLENSFHIGLISLTSLLLFSEFRLGVLFLTLSLIFFFVKTFFVENIELIQLQLSSTKKNTEKQHLQNYLHFLQQTANLVSNLLICSFWLFSLFFLVYTLSVGERNFSSFLFGLLSTIYLLVLLVLSKERKFQIKA